MALRDQPYLPLYIQDFLTDEKLMMCSAESTGVYIRIMCVMHKSEEYGKILLQQKFKQNDSTPLNFASQLVRFLPYDMDTIYRSIDELISENVLQIEGDALVQKRMVKDCELSQIRASAGSKGGKNASKKRKDFGGDFAIAKVQANTENENENEINNKGKGGVGEKPKKSFSPPTTEELFAYMMEHIKIKNWHATESRIKNEAEKFVNHYTANGWLVGRAKMKDWKASARNWLTNCNLQERNNSGQDDFQVRARKAVLGG